MGSRKIPNSAALCMIEEGIKAGIAVRLTVRGNSMSPALLDSVDVVTLHPCDPAGLKPGEIILFRYKERFLLHRITQIAQPVSPNNSSTPIITKGDALTNTETITFADVIAVAEVPRHTLLTRGYRQLWFLGYKVRMYIATIRAD